MAYYAIMYIWAPLCHCVIDLTCTHMLQSYISNQMGVLSRFIAIMLELFFQFELAIIPRIILA